MREIGVDEEGGARTLGKEDETRLRKKRRAVEEEAPESLIQEEAEKEEDNKESVKKNITRNKFLKVQAKKAKRQAHQAEKSV